MNLFKDINLSPEHKWINHNHNNNVNVNYSINKYKYDYDCEVTNVPLPESGLLLISVLIMLLFFKRASFPS